MFPTERAASALAGPGYAKSSMVGCLENYFEKQIRQERQAETLDDVAATLDRQDIAGLGDDSVVYEGARPDRRRREAVAGRHRGACWCAWGGRPTAIVYTTQGSDSTDVLTPAIDASVARLRAAPVKGSRDPSGAPRGGGRQRDRRRRGGARDCRGVVRPGDRSRRASSCGPTSRQAGTSSTRGQTSDAALDATAAKVESCKPFLAFSKANKKNPRAKSPNFDHEQSNVTNTVSVYPSTAKAVAGDAHVLRPAPARLLRASCSARCSSSSSRRTPSRRSDRVGGHLDRAGDRRAHRRRSGGVPGHGRRRPSRTAPRRRSASGSCPARVGDALVGYSWTSDTDISAALQPAIVQSVSRLQRRAVSRLTSLPAPATTRTLPSAVRDRRARAARAAPAS